MRSQRRIAFYILGGLVFLGGYSVYAAMLGGLDGLPPLPEEYAERPHDDSIVIIPPTTNPTDVKLREAFGSHCVETDYTIKIEVRARGMVLAAGEFFVEPDGRAQLTPFSVAMFGKTKNGQTEINTIHCDRAYLTFDQPIKNVTEMGGRKIVEAEFLSDLSIASHDKRQGTIHVSNNRKTATFEDDIVMLTPGPIHYADEPKRANPTDPLPPHIWSAEKVEMIDFQNLPHPVTEATLRMPHTDPEELRQNPNIIEELRSGKRGPLATSTGLGLRLFLNVDPQKNANEPVPAGSPPRKNTGSINGVERIELSSNVLMNLWIDSRSNFLGGSAPPVPVPDPKQPVAKVVAPEKVLVQIKTSGVFKYNVVEDKARYDIAPTVDPKLPNHVLVTRYLKANERDLLACDSLEMQFRRQKTAKKPDTPQPAPGNPQENMQIETVHAWGKTVAVSSDAEQLQAWGNDLVYDALQKTTTFFGDKLVVLKDGNLIEAYQLVLAGMDNKDTQQARIKGPGRIGLGNIDPQTKTHARQAHWKDWLIYGKDKQKEQIVDVMTLTGGAMFVDALNGQSLTGRELKLWLIEAPKKANGSGDNGRKPQRMQATGNVVAHSADIEIEKADYLNVWFRDVPPKPVVAVKPIPIPMPMVMQQPMPMIVVAQPMPMPMQPTPMQTMPVQTKEPKLAEAPKEPEAEKKPLRIRAKQIETWAIRDGERIQVERAHCDGNVIVLQDPTKDNKTGTDIRGNTLVLDRYPEGNVMVVHGTALDRAKVIFDQLSLIGPEVTIDQRNNMAFVKGAGSMKLKSSTDLEGKKLTKETDIDVVWSDEMEFRGAEKWARFEGGVQATQVNSRLLCQTMQVTLDREVWLNQEQRPKSNGPRESAKVEFIVCDQQPRDPKEGVNDILQPVTFSDIVRDPLGRIIKFQKVDSRELNLDNPRGRTVAPGPGTVRIFQLGSKDPVDKPDPNARGPKVDPKKEPEVIETEYKLTIVTYRDRMDAVRVPNTTRRMAKFFGNTEVVHVPASEPYQPVDLAKLPENGMHLRCDDLLEVYSYQLPDGRMTQEMIARGNAKVRSLRKGELFYGQSDVVKFDESKDVITFEGSKENPAILNRVKVQGQRPEVFRGEKILYYRKSNNFDVINGSGGSTNN